LDRGRDKEIIKGSRWRDQEGGKENNWPKLPERRQPTEKWGAKEEWSYYALPGGYTIHSRKKRLGGKGA